MKPSRVTAFAQHFLNELPTSFKHTILVCEKLAPGKVVIKVSPDDHKRVKTLLDEEDPMSSLSRKAKMTDLLKGATAVGMISANDELLINMEGFIKSLVDHGDDYQ
ncbi:Hypothetical predicted protein [Prunus dulcis]|uniref:Uncharacterized protein n=1 Tax=Prunus dulcis TaxID=3755 RepID=A0A5E4ES45_PRUDU|nr:hypothetical protein L3X38_014569 [Prunus dulcis]VVA18514.1 Hypothetical predicted protein [Prunus dulcis]